MIELLSPSQIGPASTRMSAAFTFSKISGQSSVSQPCSRMSGQTPVAMSWSMARTTSTCTPWASMMCRLMSTRPWVLLDSGDRFRVQLTNSARRSSYAMSGAAGSGVTFSPWWVERTRRGAAAASGSEQFRVLLDAEQGRPGRGEQGGHGAVQLVAVAHLDPGGAAELGVGRPVRVVQGGVPDRVVGGELLLADLAQGVVVEQDMLDRDAVLHGGGELGGVLPEPAVPGHGDHGPVRVGRPGADRRRVAEPDGPEVAGHQHGLPLRLQISA